MDGKKITKIKSFWDWFLDKKLLLDSYFDNESTLIVFDQKVRELGIISWEIGPGFANSQKNALVISPGGCKGLLEISKAIISNAPSVEGWEFYSSKPPKKWERRFQIEKNGMHVEVDANDWMYVLYGFSDKTFDIVICAPELANFSYTYIHTAVSILLDGELGEEARLKWIKDVEVVKEFTKDQSNKSNSIKVLKAHLQSLINNSTVKN